MFSDNTQLSQDVVFDILSSPRRRYVLYYLRTEGGPIELTDLAEQVAAWENETDVESLSSQDRKRVYVSLYQTHVPKLAEAGIVDYDQDSGMVALTDRATAMDPFIQDESSPRPWYLYYLGLAAVSAVLLAGVAFDVAVLATVSPVIVALVVVAAFSVLTIAHVYALRRQSQELPSALEQ